MYIGNCNVMQALIFKREPQRKKKSYSKIMRESYMHTIHMCNEKNENKEREKIFSYKIYVEWVYSLQNSFGFIQR